MTFFFLLFDAALIGLIIALMEQEGFPGWAPMIGTALLVGLGGVGVDRVFPDLTEFPRAILSSALGAVIGVVLIAWACEMTLRRAAIAMGIFFAVKLCLMFIVQQMVGSVE